MLHLRGKLARGMLLLSVKILRVCQGIMMLFSSSFLRVFDVLSPDVAVLGFCTGNV